MTCIPSPWADTRRGALAAALLLMAAVAPPAWAAPKAVLSGSQTETATVTVKSVDVASRHVVVTNAAGEHFTLKAIPEMRNFAQLKPGDTLKIRYSLGVEYTLQVRGAKKPANEQTLISTRNPTGGAPGGAAVNTIVVTGNVVAVDAARHTLKLVNHKGGEVHNILVSDPEGIKALPKVKVGDAITARVSEALIIAVNP